MRRRDMHVSVIFHPAVVKMYLMASRQRTLDLRFHFPQEWLEHFREKLVHWASLPRGDRNEFPTKCYS